MVKPLPQWLLTKFAKLWRVKKNGEFDFSESIEIFNESPKKTGSILAKLYKAGWITRRKNPQDKRKRIYKIKKLDKIFGNL